MNTKDEKDICELCRNNLLLWFCNRCNKASEYNPCPTCNTQDLPIDTEYHKTCKHFTKENEFIISKYGYKNKYDTYPLNWWNENK